MTLRLDPRRPIVWRTPHSLQIGVDPMLAHLDNVSDGDARLIDALVVGVTRAGLAMLAERAGVLPHRVDELLAGVSAAMVDPTWSTPAAAPRPTITVVGVGVGAQRVAGVLVEAGHPVAIAVPGAMTRGRRPATAVLVTEHVIDPHEHERWLRRDVPHLPIVFGEVSATIGPLVEVGVTACLRCVERHRTNDDYARPAIATQLWGQAAAAQSPALATEAAIEALRMLRTTGRAAAPGTGSAARRSGAAARGTGSAARGSDSPAATFSVRLDADSGLRTMREWWPNEGCGCRGLTALPEPAPRRETGSPPAPPAPWSHAAPTTVRAPFSRA